MSNQTSIPPPFPPDSRLLPHIHHIRPEELDEQRHGAGIDDDLGVLRRARCNVCAARQTAH